MLRSMFAAVSGLRSHQTMMDVVGNNVANVNTTGYKSSRTTFQETLVQTVRGGGAAVDGGQGGVNPTQLGLGSQVGATDAVFTQGATQLTGRPTDLAIQGEGFFIVEQGEEQLLTRAGAFGFDSAGNLVGPGGERVQGWMAPDPTNADFDPATAGDLGTADGVTLDLEEFSNVTIGPDGSIRGWYYDPAADENVEAVVGQLAMGTANNPEGLERVGNGLYRVGAAAGELVGGVAGGPGFGELEAGTLEMSNVDLAQEFTNLIIAQRGFQANSRTITASDEMLQELVNLKR